VASPRHPLARRRRLDLATLAEAPLLGHKEGSVTRSLVSGLMTSRGVPPRFAMEVSSPEVLRQLARSGFGVAVLPEVSVREDVRRGHLTILKVAGWELDRVSGLLLPPAGPASRAGREFRDLLLRPSPRKGSRRGSRSGPRAPRGRSGAPGSGRALPEGR
jgi:DNA-binding transcriptional LysR family regulator